MPRMPSKPRKATLAIAEQTLMERARAVEAHGALAVATDVSKAVQLLREQILDHRSNPGPERIEHAVGLLEALLKEN